MAKVAALLACDSTSVPLIIPSEKPMNFVGSSRLSRAPPAVEEAVPPSASAKSVMPVMDPPVMETLDEACVDIGDEVFSGPDVSRGMKVVALNAQDLFMVAWQNAQVRGNVDLQRPLGFKETKVGQLTVPSHLVEVVDGVDMRVEIGNPAQARKRRGTVKKGLRHETGKGRRMPKNPPRSIWR